MGWELLTKIITYYFDVVWDSSVCYYYGLGGKVGTIKRWKGMEEGNNEGVQHFASSTLLRYIIIIRANVNENGSRCVRACGG